ncbi:putative methyltransferase [Klebsiella pneumoniae]|nr:putative methyltransferase [Klebsiella pneumoniae]
MKICLIDETGAGDGALSVLAARWGLEQDDGNPMALVLTTEHLELRKRDEPKLGGIFVDFVGGAMATGASLAAAAAKRWLKRWVLKAITCRMSSMRRPGWTRCLCAGVGRLSRADAGA